MIYIHIDGLQSEYCASLIENELVKTKGISIPKVKLKSNRNLFEAKNHNPTINTIIKILQDMVCFLLIGKREISVLKLDVMSLGRVKSIIMDKASIIVSKFCFTKSTTAIKCVSRIMELNRFCFLNQYNNDNSNRILNLRECP